MLVKISARQTSYKNYGALIELKSKSIVADPHSVMVSAAAEFSDVICLCKVIYLLNLFYRCFDTLFNRLSRMCLKSVQLQQDAYKQAHNAELNAD